MEEARTFSVVQTLNRTVLLAVAEALGVERELDYLETSQHLVRHFLADLLLQELMRLVSSQLRHQADFLVEVSQLMLKVTV